MVLAAHIRLISCAALAAVLLVLAAPAEASAAGPRLAKAVAVDGDGDGSVDAFDLSFTRAVRGRARARGPFPFTVAGWRVVRMAAPRGKRVRVGVAERSGCDVGARAKAAYRGRALTDARKRRLRRSRIDMERKDRSGPRISCAVTGDRDSNGRIDTVTLTYTKRVRASARSAFNVDRYSLAAAASARGRNVTLRLREKRSFDTGAVPAVSYRRSARASDGVRAVSRRGGRAATTTFNDTRDKVIPRLVSARTADGNGNGLLDAVIARFSEPVRADPSALAVSGATVTSAARSGRDGLAARIAEGSHGSAARPRVTFGTARKVLRDLAGNTAPRASVTPTDGAAPVLVAARTADRGGAPGRIDTLSLLFSEPVAHTPDSDGSYPFGVTGYEVAAAGGTTGGVMDLSLQEGPAADGGVRPPVGYTRGAGAPVRDVTGNEAPSHVFAAVSDGTAPRLIGATTGDADSDGKLDRVRFDFSETVNSPARACPGCGFTVAGLSPQSSLAAAGSSVQVTVAEGALNGGLEPTASYGPASGGTVADTAGNVAGATTTPSSDGAPPVALSAQTADADSDARIDRVQMTFSEPLAYAGDAAGLTSFAATGYSVSSADAAAGSSLTLRLTERPDPDTGSAPSVSYTGLGGVALRDANGVEHPGRAYAGLTRDAVAPTFVGGQTADLDALPGNVAGRVDAVELVYSEEVTGSSNPAFFSVPGRTIDSVAFQPDSVKIRVQEISSGFDTDTTVPVSYTPGDVTDVAEGPGDTADPAPAANTTATDSASPAVVSAETADTGTPNGKIDRVQVSFSEPVSYSAPTPPGISLSDSLDVSAVAVDSPTSLTATVDEDIAANGGLMPDVTVDPDSVSDLAATPNPARAGAFTGTTDGVRPALVTARFGEAAAGACGTAAVDGTVDCLRATWSEPVIQPGSHAALSLSDAPLTGLLGGSGADVDATFAPGPDPDRNREASLDYTGGGAGEVLDVAGNPSLTPGNATVLAACAELGSPGYEPNDVFAPGNPVLTDPADFQGLCAFDEDYFRVDAVAGQIHISVDPVTGLPVTVRLLTSTGAVVPGTVQTSQAPGGLVLIDKTGLADPTYWLHVKATGQEEGGYCVDVTHIAGEECDDGDPTPN